MTLEASSAKPPTPGETNLGRQMPSNGGNRPNRPLRPRGGGGPGNRRRRVVIDNQAARPNPRDQRQARQDGQRREQRPQTPAQPTGPVSVESGVSVRDLSQALGVPMPNIIKILMGLGQMRTATQSLSDEEVELIAAEVGREVVVKHAADEEDEPEAYDDPEESLAARPPVVTIMGHVDHGKTSLLDAIRDARVVATEAGGITQHIGAYQVDVDGRKITFLDTPGHEAFTAMRARGAKVTDIAVLVVAADDGVMPQTKESIAHARAAEVPLVVAINKVDLPDANIDRVKAELASEGLQPEEWGGSTQFAEVSAKTHQNLDDLLERILLVADAELDLRANPTAEASGPIIESRLDVGRGPVATVLVQRGSLKVGDAIVAGDAHGRVKALFNYKGEKQDRVGPGDPVEILGFDKPPAAGEVARVVENDRQARELANKRAERLRREQLASARPVGVSLEGLFEALQAGEVSDLNLIVRGDVVGSVEAVVSELSKFEHSEVRLNVIASGVGAITQNDIMLASASDALIVGFNVRPNAEARDLASREGVEIRTYDVIYKLTEDIEQALVGKLAAVKTEETIGEAEVRALFRVSRLGTIAGCMVTDGVVRRNANVRVVRDGTVIYTTTISQLKRFKDDVREVAEGFECGILLDGFNDVKEGDVLEIFETREIERTSLDEAAPSPTAAS
ncbi:MAG: translation initiation factor IF-2 [Actinobacteria bacterium]|nr:translation initiation factor IF-2 [Actinomycetota bacterium]